MRKVLVEKYECPIVESTYKYWMDKNGEIHRFNDLPSIEGRDVLIWGIKGKKHRKHDEPAVIIKMNGISIENQFWVKGILHREGDKPAVIKRSKKDQERISTLLYIHGLPNNNPIVAPQDTTEELDNLELKYNNDSILYYCKNGLLHRIGKPAKIVGHYHFYYENGILKERKIFYANNFFDFIVYNPIISALTATLIFITILAITCLFSF